MTDMLDVVVIGAGQAGLAVSYFLTRDGVRHVILERGAVGESWRDQRWDSFCLNTPNWCNNLPGLELDGAAPDAFGARDDLVAYFERYVREFDLPIKDRTPATALRRLETGGYEVDTADGPLRARAVVLATGSMSRPRLPALAGDLPDEVQSLSAGEYRNADALPDGGVLVVGTGQSGCQIVEDLLEAGKRVFVSASRVGRVPRSYRGRDILAWWRDMGFLDVAVDELEDPSMRFATQPQVSGTGGGHTVSLQSLARDGATLLGRLLEVRGSRITLADDLLDSIAFGDAKSQDFKTAIDEWIDQNGVEAEAPSDDPGEPMLPDLGGSDTQRELDLSEADVGSVVWCTGFDADWSWVEVDVFDTDGSPRHVGGVTESRGLYFIGHPWLARRGSGILYGVGQDAAGIVKHVREEVLVPEID